MAKKNRRKEPAGVIQVFDYRRIKFTQYYCTRCVKTFDTEKIVIFFCPFCRGVLVSGPKSKTMKERIVRRVNAEEILGEEV